MKRQDYLLLALLTVLLFTWPIIDRQIIQKNFYHAQPRPAAKVETASEPATNAPSTAPEIAAPKAEPVIQADVADEAAVEEKTATLSNDKISLTFSSRGGSIKDATLKDYRAALARDSGPMVLDFSSQHALAYEGLPGFGENNDFTVTADEAARMVTFEKSAGQGLRFTRVMKLNDTYVVSVEDTFINESQAAVTLPAVQMKTGPMHREAGQHLTAGLSNLGVDTLSPGGETVKHWGMKIAGLFKTEMQEKNLAQLPESIVRSPNEDAPVDWVAAKNKYFVQIVTPEETADGAFIHATRDVNASEKMTPLVEISASILFPEVAVEGGQSATRKIEYYVGPMKYAELHTMSLHRVDVMELGMWRPVGKVLLVVMNFIHDHLWPHNYGVAIILLTFIVRTVFWPITHKSTESMKRMAQMQPMVAQIREKYKDNPQRVQQEIMALYKEHKINPIGGCLPMLIQIPIFIALFMVLRTAIELRFASFLWIKDLSEPENLFAGVVGFPINILPILMALTMFVQQKMTPTTGDPAQAKMMRIMMPGMMLFFLYNYAAGLALYWTTQNLLMIFQQITMQRLKKT